MVDDTSGKDAKGASKAEAGKTPIERAASKKAAFAGKPVVSTPKTGAKALEPSSLMDEPPESIDKKTADTKSDPDAKTAPKPSKNRSARFAWLLVFLLIFFIGGVAATPYLLPQAMPYLPDEAKAFFAPLTAPQDGTDLSGVTAKLNQLDAGLKDVRQMASAAQADLRALPAPVAAASVTAAAEGDVLALTNRLDGLAQQLEQLSSAQADQADAYARLQTSLDEIPAGEDGGVSPVVVASLKASLEEASSARGTLADSVEGLSAQMDALSKASQAQAQALAQAPAADTASAQALSDVATALRERLTRLEERLDVVSNAANAAAAPEALANVNTQVSSALGDFSARLEALENVRQQATAAMVAGLESARLAQAVSNGRAYAAEIKALTQLKAQAGPALPDITDLLRDIAPFAESGIPSGATLSAQLEERAREILTAIDTPDGANWWERLLARLRNLVVVRSVEPGAQGAAPPDVLARAEIAARAGEWDQVVSELDVLPDAAKASLGTWWSHAQARATAQRALADLSARLGVAAAQTPPAAKAAQ